MKSLNQSLVVICLATVILVLVLYVSLRTMLLHSYSLLEEQRVTQNAERIINALSHDIHTFEAIVANWASLEETRSFFQQGNRDFVDANLTDSTFSTLRVNVMVLLESGGAVVAQKGFDLLRNQEIRPTANLVNRLPIKAVLARHAGGKAGIAGIVLIPEGPMITVLRPVVSGQDESRAVGAVMMGRYLDKSEIDRLAARMKMNISGLALNDPDTPPDLKAGILRLPDRSPVTVRPISREVVSAYIDLKDIRGKPAFILRMDEPRDIRLQGQTVTTYLLIALLTVGSVFGIITVLLVSRSERDLATSEERYRTVVENQTELICRFKSNGRLTFVNEAFSRYVGKAHTELTGTSFFRFVSDEDRPEFAHYLASFTRLNPTSTREYRLLDKTGRAQWQEWTHRAIFDQDGKIVQFQSVGRDISQLKRALRDSEEAKDRIDGILRSVSEGLIVTDFQNRIVLMNHGARILLGVKPDDVMDQPAGQVIQDARFADALHRLLEGNAESLAFDFEAGRTDGESPRIWRGRSSVIKDKAGRDTGVVTVIHDVTGERTMDRMKTEFISTAAHQLRTPLTTIQGFSDLLMDREVDPGEQRKFVRFISEEAANLAGIVNDLLDIARIEAQEGFAVNLDICDVRPIINELVDSFSRQYDKHEFQTILCEECGALRMDSAKTRQVFENILSNSVKYSPRGGLIKITADRIADSCRFTVEDQGLGMTTETLDRIFDKFYRADASNTGIPGTGLGMTIVKYIVEAHGGEIWVESEYGEGTKVAFTIPLNPEGAESGQSRRGAGPTSATRGTESEQT